MRTVLELMVVMPLLMVTIRSLFALLARVGLRSTFVAKDYAFHPSVSVVVPVYNESEQVFKTIESLMANEYPADRLEVIAVDDCSVDDTYEWLQKAAATWPRVRVLRNPTNMGKHHGLLNALPHTRGEIIVSIDSDAIFDRRAIAEVSACFADPEIGAVGGRIGVSNPKENWLTACQTLLYYYVFHVAKMWQNWTRNVLCISGCFYAVRRNHLLAIVPQIRARNWFGIPLRGGEDSFMTLSLLLRGVKTYCNPQAQCWTAVPNNLRQFFMQQLRWRRSAFRNLFWMLRRFPALVKVFHPVTMVYVMVKFAALTLWPIMLIEGLLLRPPGAHAIELAMGVVACVAMGCLFGLYAQRHNPEQQVNAFSVAFFGLWMTLDMLFLSVLALCTQDEGGWGTRGVARQPASETTDEASPTHLG